MTRRNSRKTRGGFTLIEVLVTLMFLAIVLPAVMQGISTATQAGSSARRRTEATGLAQSKLAEIAQQVTTAQSQGGSASGDFGTDGPGYRWESTVQDWPLDTTSAGIQQIDVKVLWTERGHQESLTLSTVAYPRGQS